jgi:Zn-dependent protease with chaperone function
MAVVGTQTGVQPCPSCHAELPLLRGYSPWCESCGWNLRPNPGERPATLKDRLWVAAGRRAGDRLYQTVVRSADLRPRLTGPTIAAFVIAGATHVLTAAFVIGGVSLLIRGWGNPAAIVGALALIALAWILRPRLGTAPPGAVTSASLPATFSIADEVARAVDTRGPDVIAVDGSFNAAVWEFGLPRRRALSIGLPLLGILSPEERLAVLAHEFGHFSNGDPLRGAIVGTAVDTLVRWHVIIQPDYIIPPTEEGAIAYVAIPMNVVLLAVASIPIAIARLLVLLLFHDSQQAEYLADVQAARVAGAPALLSAWDRFHLSGVYAGLAASESEAGWLNGSLIDELNRRIELLPARERERARRAESATGSRLDATHPPTSSRIDLIRTVGSSEPSLTIDAERWDAMDAELRSREAAVQSDVVDRHLDSLYYG